MFDGILNVTLAEKVSLNSLCPLIVLINTKHKNNKTDPTH